ncbi:hypothetical protein ASE01_23510 [Nocardioides sp. Root190]|uniref:MlaD family protein n=1 Tax=Nocardioides sp. Root190 TaxID=1736488 RepID=UPI0006F7745B|nr:MCE family protein [Nocardioides sp. Root190]KRB79277.1 hypothetical protein ASE01_23510 [Nocardioides sp. Root190]
MSEFLFPHSKVDPRTLRLRLAAIGLAGGLMVAAVLGVLGLQTLGVLSDAARVTVQLPTVGDTLAINSDVKYNGLRVGRVIEVDPVVRAAETGWDGPTATVLVETEHAELIPASVRARVLPGTLFGNDFVDLVAATSPGQAETTAAASTTVSAAGGHLADGDVVEADTSEQTLRLMDTLSATQRLLVSIDPAQWDVALSQLADSLDGRGATIATMVADANGVLGRWEDLQPTVRRDVDLLTANADLLADIEPQLVRTLRDTRPLARTLVRQQEGTTTLLRGITTLLEGKEGVIPFLLEHGDETARLLNATAANLEVFAARYPSFARVLQKVPQLLRNGAKAVQGGNIQMEGVLGPTFVGEYGPQDCPEYYGATGRCTGGGR